MREDNPEKRMFYKYIFLLAVTVLIVIVYIWKWTADDPKEEGPEEMFQQEEQAENSDQLDGLNEKRIDDMLADEEDTNADVKEGESQQESNHMEENLEQAYLHQYGEEEIEQAKEQAQTVLALYLLQITDWDKWTGTVTPDYLQSMKKEMANSTQENVKRELDDIELFASQPQGNKTITYGAFASWHVTVKGKSTSQPIQLYYITLEKEGEEWIVREMITPDNENMEGERKGEK